jgi:glycosyltransferase involved in cell wall biosynthesis
MSDWWAHAAFWREAANWAAWAVALLWAWRASETIWRIGEVADLTSTEWSVGPSGSPTLAVIVPARDEERDLRATLEALAAQEYPWLRVVVVDDRSRDATGAIAEEFAQAWPERFRAVHLEDLPEGWMGKTWALEVGCEQVRDADWLLFTDADVQHSPSILWRALGYAETQELDHLVVLPTLVLRRWTEGVMLGFFTVLSLWAMRPWRVRDVKARRDIAGVGAFNLVRREAFEEIGGWRPQAMMVVEDAAVGARMKAAGMRTDVAFAPGRVLVHWASGLRGIVRTLTKNIFATVNFRPWLLLLACVAIVVMCLAPVAGLFWVGTLLPCVVVMVAIARCYAEMARLTGIPARYGWGWTLGAGAMLWAMLRSMAVVMVRRGVTWRGTFYPLQELRRLNDMWRWEREAAALRDHERRMKPTKLRRWVDSWRRKQ